MRRLRQAAARERRAPIYWWLATMLATGGGLVWAVHVVSRPAALLLAAVLAAAWVAPLAALQSLAVPRRAKASPPAPGEGAFGEWMKQARLLGRLLLYYGDNPDLPADVRQALRAAREDLRDTLKAHPLRDDLERVCGRIRAGAVAQMKAWRWRQHRPRIQEITAGYAQGGAGGGGAGRGDARGPQRQAVPPHPGAPPAPARVPPRSRARHRGHSAFLWPMGPLFHPGLDAVPLNERAP